MTDKKKMYILSGQNFIFSDKLRASMDNRIAESASGRVLVPTDIVKRLIKENLNNPKVDAYAKNIQHRAHSFCIAFYNNPYDWNITEVEE